MASRSPRPAAKPEPARRKAAPAAPPPPRRPLLGRLFGGVVMLCVWGLVAVAALVGFYALDLPDLREAAATTRRPSITLLAADGRPFASFGEVHGRPMPLAEIPKALPEAVLATEDRRFYSHFGIDPIGLARAMLTNLRAGRVVQGGSTITQQLAKNLFLTPERSLKRKVQELLMALWLERAFTKEQILTLYLNRVYFGSGTFGVDAAARRYFDLPAEKLGVYQAAMIAGLLKAPSRYNPLANPKLARQRTEQVLLNMAAAGYLPEAEARRIAAAGAPLVTPRPAAGRYFADWLLEQVEDYVAAGDQDAEVLTTLDLDIQLAAERALDKVLDEDAGKGRVAQGAVVVLSPDGAVRAMVGGRDYGDSQFNRATQALRQPGSAFKPFVYLAALEQGLTPDSLVEDAPVRLGNWQPGNFDDRFRGPIPLREALAQSVNTVAVRLTEKVGRRTVAATAHRLGITTPLAADASLALGTSEVTLLDLAGAYAVLANGGTGVWPHGFSELRDRQGRVLYRRDGGGPGRLVARETVAALTGMMEGVITRGTGKAAAFGRPAAAKTGTTQEHRDAWFMGFTADYVAGVWVGNDDGSPMRKVTGGGLPAQIWRRVMEAAHTPLAAQPARPVGAVSPAAAKPAAATGFEGDGVGELFKKIFGG